MSDSIVVNVLSPEVTNINVNDTGENIYINPLTLNQGIINHSVTHQSGGSDELLHNLLGGLQGGSGGNYYHLTSGQYANLVTGSVIRPSDTGAFYPASNPSGFITGVNLSGYVTGDVVRPSETGNFITVSQTGAFYPRSNPSGFIDPSQTGAFYAASNPSGFITGVDLSAYVTGEVVRPSQTGAFYPASNPSGFITGVDLSAYVTGSVVRPSETGSFITTAQTGAFYPVSNPSGYITGSVVRPNETGSFLTTSTADIRYVLLTGNQTISGVKAFVSRPTVNGTGVMLSGESLGVNTGELTGAFYPLNSNPSNYVTGSVVRPSETGSFITSSQTGAFYPTSNPSGYITGIDLSSYTTITYVTGISGNLQQQITTLNNQTGGYVLDSETGNFITTAQTGAFYAASNPSGFITGIPNIVYTTGDQDISGLKDFQTRPTVVDVPVLLSGDAVDTIHLYGKNHEAFTLYKGYPVYISGANGANPLISLAANSGETTSSKTIGLMAADTASNAFGYIITEGFLEGFDTSAANAGDPMWLGPTGNILYGTGNKPYGNNNLVALGVVLRANSQNGKVYVKIQNGFEIDELHGVYAKNPQNKDSLFYDSTSGAWFARQVTTGDVSGINNYYLASNPSGFVTGSVVRPSETGIFLTTTPASFTSDTLATALSDENGSGGGFVRAEGATLSSLGLSSIQQSAIDRIYSNQTVVGSPAAAFFDDFLGNIVTDLNWELSFLSPSFTDNPSLSSVNAFGLVRFNTSTGNGSFRNYLLRAYGGTPQGAITEVCFAIPTFSSMSYYGGLTRFGGVSVGVTADTDINSGRWTFLSSGSASSVLITGASLPTGATPRDGDFVTGKKYRVRTEILSVTGANIRILECDATSNSWSTVFDGIIQTPTQDRTIGQGSVMFGLRNKSNQLNRILIADWFSYSNPTFIR